MATEPFLINPILRYPHGISGEKSRRRRVVSIDDYPVRKAIPGARKKKRTARPRRKVVTRAKRKVSRPRRKAKYSMTGRVHRPVVHEVNKHLWVRSPRSYSKRMGVRINPLGEEVLIMGVNRRRRRKMLSNAWFNDHAGHVAAARKGWRHRRRSKKMRISVRGKRRGAKRVRRRAKRKSSIIIPSTYRPHMFATNPRRRRRARRNPVFLNPRRRRRNPALPAIIQPVSSALPLIATGTVGAVVTNTLPRILKTTGYVSYGVQAGSIVGGSYLVNRFLGREHARAWIIGGGIAVLSGIVQGFVNKALALSGIELGREEYSALPQEYAALPQEYEGIEDIGREEYADAYFGVEGEEDIAY